MPSRHFSPDEANEALDLVRPLVERMVVLKRELDEAEERRDDAARSIAGNGGGIPPQELAALHQAVDSRAASLAGLVSDLDELGVLVKDIDSGLVDFPSIRGGEEVLLCWRLGEERVAFWHGPEDGFAGRRPL